VSEVVFVGTSNAFGAGGRRQSAIVLRGARGSVLVDCGATTNTGLAEVGIERDEIDTIVISHFHGDHFGGIPLFLLAALYEDERSHPLEIAGPPDIEARVRGLAEALGHPMQDQEWSFPLRFSVVAPGAPHEIGPATVESFETRHAIEAHPHGYRIDTGTETIVYSGDTGWFPELPGHAAGADLFICECTFRVPTLDFHLSHDELLAQRAKFDCGRMMLTHLGSEMSERRSESEFETADDGLVLKL
jgi:ribonuclease BN (tRNA processing enzyme)